MPSHHVRVTELAARIKALREARGLSMNELDDLCSKSEGYVSRVESGQRKGLRPDTIELLAAALRSTFGYVGAGMGPKHEVPVAPAHWESTRKGVAMRVLLMRGYAVDLIEAAVARYAASADSLETTASLVANIEREIKNPTPPEELAERARRRLDSQEPDTLAMARRAAAALESEHGLTSDRAWGVMREIRLHKPTTDGLVDEAIRLLGLKTDPATSRGDDPKALTQLERQPGKKPVAKRRGR